MQYAVPKHYLWAIGEGIKACRPGELIAGRYLLKGDRILLDTQSEQYPEMPEDIPGFITPYLRLFPHRLHVPEVYGVIPRTTTKLGSDIWLLENGPLSTNGEGLMPELAIAWKNATAMRQLSWLWQIAQLWQPCSSQAVASTLLNPQLLRVEGPLVRLLELQPDQKAPNFSHLGQLWQQWVGSAHPTIASFLRQLCQQMTAGQVRTAEQSIGQLDKALALCGRSLDRTIYIATGTDTGPTRSHNEDACYPPNGTAIKVSPGSEACAIVCDGIGGQDGGEVASELAVTTLRDRVQLMLLHPANCDPQSLTAKLERSACAANDAISGRNDSEHRQLRQRMGTTVVMAIAHAHELYIAHVGDSRAYWITRSSCRQVTLDDDVACREVRLGYALYRDALQQVAAGALVQALGITSSATLHPTVQRFPVDEDCIFLLCSDGLSDKERIDECWENEILPILDGTTNVAKVKDRLIEIANTRNGHDNVTIALIYCQVRPKEEGSTLTELSIAPLDVPAYVPDEDEDAVPNFSIQNAGGNSSLKTQFFPRPKNQSPLPYLLGILLLLVLGGLLLAYFFNRDFSAVTNRWFQGSSAENPIIDPASPSAATPVPTAVVSLFKNGDVIEVRADAGIKNERLILSTDFGQSEVKGTVPLGSILEVINTQSNEQGTWLEVKVCSLPDQVNSSQIKLNTSKDLAKIPKKQSKPSPSAATPTASPTIKTTFEPEASKLKPGETGWIKEEETTLNKIDPNLDPNLVQKCNS